MEPPKKRARVRDQDIKSFICSIQCTFFERLKMIEDKIEILASRYNLLEEKIETILNKVPPVSFGMPTSSSVMPDDSSGEKNILNNSVVMPDDSSSEKNILNNSVEDYPDGSWLGDPDDPNLRVRCHISPKVLKDINKISTPEKMSLILLDHLFARKVQACSNLTGTGIYGKRQLDPHKIFGIKCHLVYKFGITENHWNNIKTNINSKCRTSFRRILEGKSCEIQRIKLRPSLVKAVGRSSQLSSSDSVSENSNEQTPITTKLEPSPSMKNDLLSAKALATSSVAFPGGFDSQFVDTAHGRIQVIHATQEQFEQWTQNHQIEVISDSSFKELLM